jgi:hypothetical protein
MKGPERTGIALSILCLLLACSCEKSTGPGEERETFSGTTETDQNGDFSGSIDTTDWGRQSYDGLFVSANFWMEKPVNDTISLSSSHPGELREAHLAVFNLTASPLTVTPSTSAPFSAGSVQLQTREKKEISLSYVLPDSTRFVYSSQLTLSFSTGESRTLTAVAGPERTDTIVVSALPRNTCFYPAYPNPTDGSVVLHFALVQARDVTLVVKSPERQIRTILNSSPKVAGMHSVTWDLRDDLGARIAPGVYRVTFSAGAYSSQGDISVK